MQRRVYPAVPRFCQPESAAAALHAVTVRGAVKAARRKTATGDAGSRIIACKCLCKTAERRS